MFFIFHNTEHATSLFIGIGEQFKREAHFPFEFFVRGETVARYAEYGISGCLKLLV